MPASTRSEDPARQPPQPGGPRPPPRRHHRRRSAVPRGTGVVRPGGLALTVIGPHASAAPGSRGTAPRLLAEDPASRVVVREDVGTGDHLAARLLGTDPGRAGSALDAWARSIGALLRAGPGLADDFASEVAGRARDLSVCPVDDGLLPRAVDRLVPGLTSLRVVLRDTARDDLLHLRDASESDWLAPTPATRAPTATCCSRARARSPSSCWTSRARSRATPPWTRPASSSRGRRAGAPGRCRSTSRAAPCAPGRAPSRSSCPPSTPPPSSGT